MGIPFRERPFTTGPQPEKSHDPLDGLDCRELAAVYDALIGATDAVTAIHNQPRTSDRAAAVLSELHSGLSWQAQGIEHRLRTMKPTGEFEREDRARVVLHWVFQCGDHMDEVFEAAERIAGRRRAERED
jgi:hypothetical protein